MMVYRSVACAAVATVGWALGTPGLASGAKPPAVELSRAAEPAPRQQSVVWLPGVGSPFDVEGNRALADAPRPGEGGASGGEGGDGGLRGLPSWVPFGPAGADAQSVAASPTAAGVVIAGMSSSTGGGAIYRSSTSGTSWTLATGTGNRVVRAVEFGSDGVGWAATDDGLFRSVDGGQTWTPVALPIAGQALVRDVAVAATAAQTVWVGIGQFLNGTSPFVVFRTTDGGGNWADVSPPVTPGMGATAVAVDPTDPQRVYAAFTPNFGGASELWVTTDGGVIWDERSLGLPNVPINDIAFGADGTVWLAGGQDFGGQFLGLYTTTDDGLTWAERSAGWPSRAATSVAIDPANSQSILVGTTRAGLARSTDGGATWGFGSGGTGTYQVNAVEFVPGTPATVFLGMGSVAVFRSTDGGASFSPSSNGISRLEITSFAVNPLDSQEIAASYVGVNDGGIYESTDGGQTWQLSQAPLPRWQKVYFAPNGILYGTHNGPLGRADDGLWRRSPGSGLWTNLGPGSPSTLDTIGLDIAATTGSDPVILWGGYRWFPQPQVAQIWSYNRAGTGAWALEYQGSINIENVYTVQWLGDGAGPVALAGVVNFGQGAGAILRSDNFGDTWSPSENGYPSEWNAWKIAAGPQDGSTAYAVASAGTGQLNGGTFKTTDGGLNWTQQGAHVAYRYLAADPLAAGTLFSLIPFNNARPQRSTDDGATYAPYDTNFLSTGGGRGIFYGGVVGGARRLFVATSAGGFATDLPGGGGPACPADWNDDDLVNSGDITAFLTDWLASVQHGTLTGDFNGDGQVNSGDITAFLTAWLEAVQHGGC